ncbi:hypothetical protein [Microbacterium sp. PRC9]|nr:hypothetical protein [Microbacterium sp. PRC9]MDT0142786.1 hypothetical protein [Microbacterium sp. PRC9]
MTTELIAAMNVSLIIHALDVPEDKKQEARDRLMQEVTSWGRAMENDD